MNRRILKFTRRTIVLLLPLIVFTLVFVWSRSSASEQVNSGEQNQKQLNETKINSKTTPEIVTLKAEKRGFPLLNLQDGKKLQTDFIGSDGAAQSFNESQAKPLVTTDADLNGDGAMDLIVGYADSDGSGGGHLAYYQGSLDTLSARTPEIFEGMKEGRFPAPFLPQAKLIKLPVTPDFIGIGDFNRDGWKDIVAAERGSDEIYLLTGNSKNLFNISRVEIPGRITAMLAENIDPLDNAVDVAVAVAGENSAAVLVYKDATDVFAEQPETYPLPAEATSLAIGQLDDAKPMDILAAGSGDVSIIHGAYPAADKKSVASRNAQVETLIQGSDVAAARVGNFVWDRDYRPEIALLSSDGSVEILQRGTLDTRDYSPEEWKTRWKVRRDEALARDAVRGKENQRKLTGKVTQNWTVADRMQVSAPLAANRATASSTFFTSARMSTFGVDDLLVLDSASRKLHVLVWNNDDLKNSGESYALSASGGRADISFDVEGTPVAALPMRLSVMTRPGIVLLNEGSSDITYVIAAPAATFTVTKTADTYDGAYNADCSVREALQAANATTAADMIMIPAGTYTITIGPADAETTIDPAAQQSGDWDVFFDTTITGAGQATTILQAGTTQSNGIDRVLDAIQTQVGVPDLSLSGLTLQNGRCLATAVCVDGGGLHYAVDALAALTISNSTFTNN